MKACKKFVTALVLCWTRHNYDFHRILKNIFYVILNGLHVITRGIGIVMILLALLQEVRQDTK